MYWPSTVHRGCSFGGIVASSKKTFGKFPRRLIHSSPSWAVLGWRAKGVLAVLVVMADGITKSCYPSRETIQKLAGFAKIRDVDLGIAELEESGIIEKVTRLGQQTGKNRTNLYFLKFDLSVDFGQLPSWVVKDGVWSTMTKIEQALYVALAGLAYNKTCSPSQTELRHASGIQSNKSLTKATRALEEKGLVSTTRGPYEIEYRIL